MKKICIFIWLIGALYFVSIFTFPVYADKIAWILWLEKINAHVREFKSIFEETLTSYDLFGKVKDTTTEALELKQNIETNIEQTQQKIQTIKTNLDETKNAINQTTQWIDNTLKSIDKLKESVVDVVPTSVSGTLQTQQKIEEIRSNINQTKTAVQETASGIQNTKANVENFNN